MSENCKDCVQVENIKADIKDIFERLREVEKFSSSGGEQIKMIFKMLNEIKGSIDKIGDKLEDLNKNAVNAAKVEGLEEKFNDLNKDIVKKEELKEIKKQVQEVQDSNEEIKLKPVQDFSKFKWIIITAFASSVVGAVIGFIIKNK